MAQFFGTFGTLPAVGDNLGDRVTVQRVIDGRLQHFAKRHSAVSVQRGLPTVHSAGHAHRKMATRAVIRDRVVSGFANIIDVGSSGLAARAIQGDNFSFVLVPDQREHVTANAG